MATIPSLPFTGAELKTALDDLNSDHSDFAVSGPAAGSGITSSSGVVLGRYSAGTGPLQDITIGSGLSLDTGTGVLSASGGGGVSDGATLATGLTFPNDGLRILDTDDSHDLVISTGSGLTADRTLTITTGDADRTLTFSGDATISGTNTGDQTITLTGDITGSGSGSFATTIANDAVTYAKLQNASATDVLLGRATVGAGDYEEIACTSFGRSLLDDANAATGRTTLGVDAAGTDNSTPVTLAGSLDYLSISTQEITLNHIDLTTDVSGDLPLANLTPASTGSVLLGRGDSGSGDFQEITIGANLNMSGTTLSATGYDDDNYSIPANILLPQDTGPEITTITTTTNGVKIGIANFDGTVIEVANFSDARPKNWDDTDPTAKFRWQAATGGAGLSVVWGIAITAINEGEPRDVAPTWVEVTDAVVTVERDQLTAATAAIPIQGTLTADSRLQFWVRRNTLATGDNMSVDARLVSVDLTFALS